jgi:acyl-CoA thioesterase-1
MGVLTWLRWAVLGAALLAAPAWGAGILVHGDSLSAGYGLERGQEWPALLEQQLQRSAYKKLPVHNSSISGETTTGGLARLPAMLTAHRPDVLIVALGANDALQGQDLQQSQRNLQAMVDLGQAAGAKVLLLASDIPPNYGARYHAQFQQMFSDMAAQDKLPIVRFSIQEFAQQPGFLQKDALHPTAKAQPVIAQRVWAQLQPVLAAATSPKNARARNLTSKSPKP